MKADVAKEDDAGIHPSLGRHGRAIYASDRQVDPGRPGADRCPGAARDGQGLPAGHRARPSQPTRMDRRPTRPLRDRPRGARAWPRRRSSESGWRPSKRRRGSGLATRDTSENWRSWNKERNGDTFDATMVNQELASLLRMKEIISQKLEQLYFDSKQEVYRVTKHDEAQVTMVPVDNKRGQYMAAALVGIFFLIIGLVPDAGDPGFAFRRSRRDRDVHWTVGLKAKARSEWINSPARAADAGPSRTGDRPAKRPLQPRDWLAPRKVANQAIIAGLLWNPRPILVPTSRRSRLSSRPSIIAIRGDNRQVALCGRASAPAGRRGMVHQTASKAARASSSKASSGAARVASSCSGRLAPTIAEVIPGWCKHPGDAGRRQVPAAAPAVFLQGRRRPRTARRASTARGRARPRRPG